MARPRDESTQPALVLRWDFLDDAPAAAAYRRFLVEVFDVAPPRSPYPDPAWEMLGTFEANGACIAGIEVGTLELVLDGTAATMTAIRLAGVIASHRGLGLFRDLMEQALARCDSAEPTLLYTADHALYTRFGFVPLAQHAFVGAAPVAAPGRPARRLDIAQALALVDRLAPVRSPISHQCALHGATDLLRANIHDDDLQLAFAEDLDALLIIEDDDEELVVVDIVAPEVPTMAQIVGALRPTASRVRTLFPPDRLGWHGTPESDETGLMIRGAVPPAMRRPFMLPPTASF